MMIYCDIYIIYAPCALNICINSQQVKVWTSTLLSNNFYIEYNLKDDPLSNNHYSIVMTFSVQTTDTHI